MLLQILCHPIFKAKNRFSAIPGLVIMRRQTAIQGIFYSFEKRFYMATTLKYMVDENGDKTSVLVPLKTWEKMNLNYSKLQNKLKVLTGIKEGFAEVSAAKKSGKK